MKARRVYPAVDYIREVLQSSLYKAGFSSRKKLDPSTATTTIAGPDSQRDKRPKSVGSDSHSNSTGLNIKSDERDAEYKASLIDWIQEEEGSQRSDGKPEDGSDSSNLLTKETAATRLSRTGIERKSKHLLKSLSTASSHVNQVVRLQELSKHLIAYPEAGGILTRSGAISAVLRLRHYSQNTTVQANARQALALMGYVDPPRGRGIRILSVDGGGARGAVILEILKRIEKLTNKPIHESFDLMCGVSAGAMITTLVGALKVSLKDCDAIYQKFTQSMFQRDLWGGTQRLLLTHAYYDSKLWNKILKEIFTEKLFIETSQKKDTPKILNISAVVNTPELKPYVFRNYNTPEKSLCDFDGACHHKIWEAIRASSAAPGYFEEFVLGNYVHQDGGVLMNNPTAVALHEAQLLWPNEEIQCIVSIGSGKYSPLTPLGADPSAATTSLKNKISRLIESATDTEAIHRLLQDLMKPGVYYRLNPSLSEYLYLDESRPEKLEQMKTDAQMYMRKNDYKLSVLAGTLLERRHHLRSLNDWIHLEYMLRK